MKNHLHIDPFSGIAGDMFLGAAIELGISLEQLSAAFDKLPITDPFKLHAEKTQRQGITATDFKVIIDNQPHHHHNHNHDHAHKKHHHHVHYPDMLNLVDQLDTTDRGKARAKAIVDKLAHAEAAVHDKPVEKVHFHEVGALDSIIDMLGAAIALELLDIHSVSCGPLPLSRGFVKCDHGIMPVPAPATALIMQGLPTKGVDREMELVTPTGAAIVAAVTDSFAPPPQMTLQKVGCGAGDKDTPNIPNILRLFLGEIK